MTRAAPSDLLLAIESSTRAVGIALGYGRGADCALLHEGDAAAGAHASALMPAIADGLAALGRAPRELAAILVDVGPGSYTGLRVGVATALGLARATGARLVGVPAGEVLAWAHLAPGEEGVHLFDIRARHVALSHYARTERGLECLRAPAALPVAELEGALPANARRFVDGVSLRGLHLDPERFEAREPRARELLAWGALRLEVGGPTPAVELRPLYLRPFEAAARRR